MVRELGSMAEKLDEYEKLLKEISPHMDSTFKQRITSALEGVSVCLTLPGQWLTVHKGSISRGWSVVRIA